MKLQALALFILSTLVSTNAGVFECTYDSDCAEKCVDNECVCPPKQTHNLQGTKCLNLAYGYEEPCEDDNQCAILGGSYKCDPNEGKCACAKGWLYLKGKCIERLKLGDPCEEHEDCFDGVELFASLCENKTCTCNVGYYNRQDYDCRELKDPGETCLIPNDCKDKLCNYGVCGTTGYSPRNLDLEEDDVNITPKFEEDCVDSKTCKGNNMYCSPFFGKCLCKKGYFLNEDGVNCDKELGTRCGQHNDDCKGIGKECIVTCGCRQEYIFKTGNRKCTRGPFAPYFDCANDSSCKIFGENSQCKDINPVKKCVCLKGYKLNEHFLCELSEGGAVKCKEDKDCDIKNSVCASTGSCICNENTIFDSIEEVCFSKLGGACKTDYDCKKIEGAVCGGDGKCSCTKNFVAKNEMECVKVSSGLGDRCIEDLQCSGGISNSACVDHSCICQEGYVEIRNACLPLAEKLGDYCSHPNMCSNLKGVVCRKSSCQCDKLNQKTIATLDGCESKANSLDYSFMFVLFNTFVIVFFHKVLLYKHLTL